LHLDDFVMSNRLHLNNFRANTASEARWQCRGGAQAENYIADVRLEIEALDDEMANRCFMCYISHMFVRD
jgi:hypothetical protein